MSEERKHLERKGYRIESKEGGVKFLCFKGRWNGERQEKRLDLAALVVREIKRDSKFADYFKKMLES